MPLAGGRLIGNAAGSGAVDLGCGSGVLAIAAAKLGWPPVLALDYDPLSVDATLENAAVNGVELLESRRFDLRDSRCPAAPLVLANLLAPLLLAWCEQTGRRRPRSCPAGDRQRPAGDRGGRGVRGLRAASAMPRLGALVRGEWAALLLDSA